MRYGRRVRRLAILAVVCACGPRPYVQPAVNEPHALLEMRHVVHAHRGPMYGASTTLKGEVIDEHTLATAQHDLDTNAWTMRIRPEIATYAVGGPFFDWEGSVVRTTRFGTAVVSASMRASSAHRLRCE